MSDDTTPASKPPKNDVRILWRQWAMNEAVMMRPASENALFELADRIFAWVTEPKL